MSKFIAPIAVFALLGIGACALLPQDSQSLQAATKIAYTQTSPIADGANASPPPGFVNFCVRTPGACTNHNPTTAAKVTIDDKTAATLVSVNAAVNDSITYESDVEHYGVANRWTLDPAGGFGDCKDYALAKREALRVAGLPESALRIAIVRTAGDELHAVLTVDTDKGVLVMDSLTPEIRPWSDTPYRWLTRQTSDDPLRWVKLAEDPIFASGSVLASGLRYR